MTFRDYSTLDSAVAVSPASPQEHQKAAKLIGYGPLAYSLMGYLSPDSDLMSNVGIAVGVAAACIAAKRPHVKLPIHVAATAIGGLCGYLIDDSSMFVYVGAALGAAGAIVDQHLSTTNDL